MKKGFTLVLAGLFTAGILTGCIGNESTGNESEVREAKPVIYLYPETVTEVSVQLDFDGDLTTTYPTYNGGWEVTAYPGGTLLNHADGREYSYLFWEGDSDTQYDLSEGWCIPGDETAAFLQDTLSQIGLTPKEYNEFIVYWLPIMEENAYNLITFQGDAYTDSAPLTISPEPDSLLRVFMAWMPLESPVEIDPPEIESFERNGFTVVEWGGAEIGKEHVR